FVAVILAAGLAEILVAVRFARRPPRKPAAEGEELPVTGSRGAALLAFVGLAVAFAALAAVAMWVAF
ncbi:MAG: LPXTG cell wall anchor domain-containing protein, partial [Solirubrobacterales bacterium]|nr:LPXTG cell wall anchor domain-containing protein [Solirubrobacterales bacterium]